MAGNELEDKRPTIVRCSQGFLLRNFGGKSRDPCCAGTTMRVTEGTPPTRLNALPNRIQRPAGWPPVVGTAPAGGEAAAAGRLAAGRMYGPSAGICDGERIGVIWETISGGMSMG